MAGGVRAIRERIYQVIDCDVTSQALDAYAMVSIVATIASIVPLAFKHQYKIFQVTEIVVTTFFTVDYLLRWLTADLRCGQSGIMPFLRYPFTLLAVVDLLSLFPTYLDLNPSLRILRTARLVRMLKMTRLFKAVRYSSSIMLIGRVLRRQRDLLLAVTFVAVTYVLISALIVFNVEPMTFHSFIDAVYWMAISLTTVGYADVYPVTLVGRIVTTLSSFFGVAIVALPASIITAGLIEELEKRGEDGDDK